MRAHLGHAHLYLGCGEVRKHRPKLIGHNVVIMLLHHHGEGYEIKGPLSGGKCVCVKRGLGEVCRGSFMDIRACVPTRAGEGY